MATERRFFLVERYLPAVSASAVGLAVDRLPRSGCGARHLCTFLVPDEETCLSLFEAADAVVVGEANERAEFPLDRIVQVEVFPRPPAERNP